MGRKTSELLPTGHPMFISENYFTNAGEWQARSSGGLSGESQGEREHSMTTTFHYTTVSGIIEVLATSRNSEWAFRNISRNNADTRIPFGQKTLQWPHSWFISLFSEYILVVGVADSNHKWYRNWAKTEKWVSWERRENQLLFLLCVLFTLV